DVDGDALILDGGVLGEDGDAALAFELVRIHHPLGHLLVGAENAALVQQGVDQGRLAVVDVGDDGDVADVGSAGLFVHGTADRTSAAAQRPVGGGAGTVKAEG